MTRYTYGDSEVAAERLRLVAEMFEPSTSAFLRAAAPPTPDLAVDLGCGPGRTTRLLHAITGAAATVGLERSGPFLAAARAGAPPGVRFLEHDATSVPFPVPPADLVYARLLLAHLVDPPAVVVDWSTTLTIGGRLLLDDLEAIEAPEPAFRTYLDDVALPVVVRAGGRMFVGSALHAMPDPPGTARMHDAVASFTPPADATARVFGLNLQVLTADGEVAPRPDLEAALGAIADGEREAAPATWRVRQVALERRA
ncbi:MAG TPA: class I SAM-dependent methyltransferase [Actinomycetota bacterium]|nr:class I SAM-dependent methyltransferase [Actinomycetota bacterium]